LDKCSQRIFGTAATCLSGGKYFLLAVRTRSQNCKSCDKKQLAIWHMHLGNTMMNCPVRFTHVSLCSRASLSLGTLSLCESLLFSPSTVSSWGRESSKRVPVVEWMYRFMEGSAGTASQDEVPRLVQLRALGCWSIR
ncbi:hypothetical protein XENOCAPTIV_002639, partial [Xenoophorus captivus]